jgi:hypothetical protein
MRSGLDPRNPAFRYMGPREATNTVLFIDEKGRLAWVPYEALKCYFKRAVAGETFYEWHTSLICKEHRK